LPSGRHDLPRDVVVTSQRDRILMGMAEAVAAHGYASTTVAQICDRAGVSRATFYDLFNDKDDCVMACGNALLGEIVTLMTNQFSPDKPLYKVVTDSLAALFGLMAARPAYASMVFLEGRVATPATRQIYTSGISVMVSLLDQQRVDGPIDAHTPSTAARSAAGAVEMLIRNQVSAGRAEELLDMLFDASYAALVPFYGQDLALQYAEEAAANPPKVDLMPFGRAHL
jgi:AcrR family transcriptional regulator